MTFLWGIVQNNATLCDNYCPVFVLIYKICIFDTLNQSITNQKHTTHEKTDTSTIGLCFGRKCL